MPIKGLKPLQDDIKKLSAIDAESMYFEIASEVKLNILTRTNKGRDFEGKEFKPYETSTEISRQRRGRRTDIVDLQDKRQMLNSIQVKATAKEGKVFFSRPREARKALMHNEIGVGRKRTKRPFFSMSIDDINKAMARVDRRIKGILK